MVLALTTTTNVVKQVKTIEFALSTYIFPNQVERETGQRGLKRGL